MPKLFSSQTHPQTVTNIRSFLPLPLRLHPLILTICIRICFARIVRFAFGIAIIVIVARIGSFAGTGARAFGGSSEAGDAGGFEGVHLAG